MTTDTFDTDRQRISELHEGWVRANGTGDIDWLRAHIAPAGPEDFVMWNTLGSNFYGLDGIVELWGTLVSMVGEAAAQQIVSESWDERIQVSGDLAVVSYLTRLVVDFGARGEEAGGKETGGKLDQVFRGTEVWQRRGDDWKMIHYHGSLHTPGVMGGE